jgi:hypothetical protein
VNKEKAMKRTTTGIAALALALFLAVQFFAPQGVLADENANKDKQDKQDANYTQVQGPNRLTQMTGATLRDPDGESLGTIEDVVFKDGSIQYAIVSVGGYMGIGDRLIPVPWEAIKTRDADGGAANEYYVEMQRDRFVRSPSFARDNWPTFTDPNFERLVFGYHRVEQDNR